MHSTPSTHRGRPVGTGIDDRQRLSAVAEMLTTHPGITPTAAIRSLGYTDPSIIRRLRDKLKSGHPDTEGAATAPRPEISRCQQSAALSSSVRPLKIAEAAPVSVSVSVPVQPVPRERPTFPEHRAADPLLITWIEMAVGTWTAAFAAQQAIVNTMLNSPTVRGVIRQHVAAGDMAMAFLKFPAASARPS